MPSWQNSTAADDICPLRSVFPVSCTSDQRHAESVSVIDVLQTCHFEVADEFELVDFLGLPGTAAHLDVDFPRLIGKLDRRIQTWPEWALLCHQSQRAFQRLVIQFACRAELADRTDCENV